MMFAAELQLIRCLKRANSLDLSSLSITEVKQDFAG